MIESSRQSMLTPFLRLAGIAGLVIGLNCSPEAGAAGRDALWSIVHDACVPHWLSAGDPSPCVRIDLSATDGTGVAILKDVLPRLLPGRKPFLKDRPQSDGQARNLVADGCDLRLR
jgi:CDP-diacylglycerol pyrophosphatase